MWTIFFKLLIFLTHKTVFSFSVYNMRQAVEFCFKFLYLIFPV